MADKLHYLSNEGLEKLKAELTDLKTVKRHEAAAKIETAKALGDLSENAEYHDAKDEMAFIGGRIREIESILKNYSIIEEGGSSVARVGSTLKVEINGKTKTYKIVGSNEADPTEGLISNESPLGGAFLGHSKGENIEVTTPAGKQEYTILDV
ncbi:transcription elongation factor GreA, partial [Patescibacteria group bacterium]|nr:transcription elongation factor GreA [Patescibacteria group bacterium]